MAYILDEYKYILSEFSLMQEIPDFSGQVTCQKQLKDPCVENEK
jgi:hypothetical protein